MSRALILIPLLLVSSACGFGSVDDSDGSGDAGDAGAADAGGDAGLDGGTPDSGSPDSGMPDSGTPDSGPFDSGTPDSGAPDSGTPDSGTPDSGSPDSGTPDSGTPGPLACPVYSPFNNGIGSTFDYDQSTTDFSATASGAIVAKWVSGGVTYIEMDWDSQATGSNWSQISATLSTYFCDSQGSWMLSSNGTTTSTTVNGTTTTSYTQTFENYLTLIRGSLPAGTTWSNDYTVHTTSGGNTTTASGSLQYRSIGPASATVPAGSFNGVEIEYTAAGVPPYRFILAEDLGTVSADSQKLTAYSLR